MIKSNLSPPAQLGFKQQKIYGIPKSQGGTIECNTVNFVDFGANYFVGDPLLYAYMHVVTPVQYSGVQEIPSKFPKWASIPYLVETLKLGILAPYHPINIENIYRDPNLKLYDIVSGRKRLLLRKPIEVTPDFRDGIWTMENKDFDIISMSPDYTECLRDFNEEVFFVWEAYGQEDDDKLTKGAQELKRKILRYIGE